MTRWLVLLAASACNASEPLDRVCTEIGCTSSVQVKLGTFPVTVFQDAAPYAVFDVCLNGVCTNVPIDTFPENGKTTGVESGELDPGPRIVVQLQQLYSSDVQIGVSIAASDAELFHDGDVFDVVFKQTDGAVVAFGRWSVDYATTQPNGPGCEPTCRQSMTLTPL